MHKLIKNDSPTRPQPSSFYTHLPACEDGTECSETSTYKIKTPGITQKKACDIQNKAKVWNQDINWRHKDKYRFTAPNFMNHTRLPHKSSGTSSCTKFYPTHKRAVENIGKISLTRWRNVWVSLGRVSRKSHFLSDNIWRSYTQNFTQIGQKPLILR